MTINSKIKINKKRIHYPFWGKISPKLSLIYITLCIGQFLSTAQPGYNMYLGFLTIKRRSK